MAETQTPPTPPTLAELRKLRRWHYNTAPKNYYYESMQELEADTDTWKRGLATLDKLIAAHTENREGEKRG